MQNIASAINDTISISLFNRGMAGKIFEEVKKSGAKVVMKNNAAECVLLSPKEYLKLIDEINEARLMTIANERLATYDPNNTVSEKEMANKLGINEEDLENFNEVEFE
ncbi:MAG: type II toxin-antitoxin system Phd/YefM family antitoxin [Ruminococcaceae bacterium]|nr:type II toxin-antitoxin system Phd/YefM family antitoxin [Oscillospiraceae bacterium]